MSGAAGAAGALIALQSEQKHRAIVAWFEERGALEVAGAVALPHDHKLSRSVIADMLRHGDLNQTAAGTYWLDRDRAEERRARTKRRTNTALGIISGVAATWAAAVLFLR